MREREMRERVHRFLRVRLRNMLMPATLGLGLALGGCDGDALSTDDGGDPAVQQDAATQSDSGTVGVKYIAQIPDAGPELPVAAPEYIAPVPDYMAQMPDAGIAVRYMAQMPDAGPDLGGAVAVYSAPVYLAQVPGE